MSEAHATPPAEAVPAAPTEPAAPAAPAAPADWRAGLPEDIAGHDLVRNSTDVAALAKQAIDMQAYQGNSIRIPSEHASDEDRAATRDKLRQHFPELVEADVSSAEVQRDLQRRMGLPEEATGYRPPELDFAPQDTALLNGFTPLAHEAGLTQGQYETIVGRMTEDQQAQRAAAESERVSAVDALYAREWGFAKDAKLAAAAVVAQELRKDGLEIPEDLSQLGAGALRAFASLGERLGGEGASLQGDSGFGADAPMTPSEAEAQLDEIYNNRKHPFWAKPSHPGRRAALDEVERLTKIMLGPDADKPLSTLDVADGIG